MKNRLIIFFILTKFLLNFYTSVFSNEIKFEATNIETIDKNLIIAMTTFLYLTFMVIRLCG